LTSPRGRCLFAFSWVMVTTNRNFWRSPTGWTPVFLQYLHLDFSQVFQESPCPGTSLRKAAPNSCVVFGAPIDPYVFAPLPRRPKFFDLPHLRAPRVNAGGCSSAGEILCLSTIDCHLHADRVFFGAPFSSFFSSLNLRPCRLDMRFVEFVPKTCTFSLRFRS